jgi:hypothetical protein
VVFRAKCRDRHPHKEFPLDSVEVCGIFKLDNATKLFPSFPGLKLVFQGSSEEMKQAYFIYKTPW